MNTSSETDDRKFLHLITLLSVSAGMVGVCLTAIGLIGIVKSLNRTELVIDDVLATASLLFLTTSLLSFAGLRTRVSQTWRGFYSYARRAFALDCSWSSSQRGC
jgi:hypothetical protein